MQSFCNVLLAATVAVTALVALAGVFSPAPDMQRLEGSALMQLHLDEPQLQPRPNIIPVLAPAALASDDQTLFVQSLLEDPRLSALETDTQWNEEIPWDEEL